MKSATKGTVCKLDIGGVMTAISQLTALQIPDLESTAFESTTIDQTGIGEEHTPTGYTKSGGFSAEGFFDIALAGQAALRGKIEACEMIDFQVVFANAEASVLDFTSAGAKFELMSAMKDGLKFKLGSTAISGQPVWTT